MNNINLKKIIEQHPDCVTNGSKLKGIILDLYPDTPKAIINILFCMADSGIINEIRTAILFSDLNKIRWKKKLKNEGFAEDVISNCLEFVLQDILPDGVTVISGFELVNDRIAGYKGLSPTVIIPDDSITCICYKAFSGCSKLTSVTIGNGVTEIGDYAFCFCEGLTDITIPDSVTYLGVEAFSDCSRLKSLIIGNNLSSIGDEAFNECRELTSVTIGNAVTSIGKEAFRNCIKIKNITIPGNVTFIYEGAFSGCNELTNVTIDDGVAYIGGAAFFCCNSLTSVIFPNSVTSINHSAFSYCNNLKSITIGNKLYTIGNKAFEHCDKLENIYINSISAWCNIKGLNELMLGGLNKKIYLNKELIIDLIIPDGVTYIGQYAFSGCRELKSVTLGKDVVRIELCAFSNCSNLIMISLSDNITCIGCSSFYECSKLTSITIPNGVTKIEYGAFERCYNLSAIIFNGTIEEWNNIKKETNYINDTAVKDILCSDGIIHV